MDAIFPINKNNFLKAVLICIFTAVLIFPADAEAKTLVTGNYHVSSSGKQIVLNLHIQNPAPANLIVEQYISPQNVIVNVGPKPKKGSPGKLKWLFRHTRSGKLSISIRLRSPLRGSIRGVVRYRDPVFGNFVEFHISP